MSNSPAEKYRHAENERRKHVDAILRSQSPKKIVVAGPGTGKTYLFKKVLEGKTNSLTLTFVNSLVEDLALELCGMSEVKTLHGFARSVLPSEHKSWDIFIKLSTVIKEDAAILLKEDIDFDYLFHNKQDAHKRIPFYRQRKDYYKHYGFADIVYAAVRYFEEHREKVPSYQQVLVDEFQDFNALEVSLIDLLAEKSPVLLTGDDDQALYSDLKSASAEHIRDRHAKGNSGYAAFTLPYCSRCTRVIVEAANDIIASAIRNGHLKGRLAKEYRYFESERKDWESEQNPKIVYDQCFDTQIAWRIERTLANIAETERRPFSVLIISPTKNHSRKMVNALEEKGLASIEFVERRGGNEPTMMDGLKILLKDAQSNLGWRIVGKCILEVTAFGEVLRQTEVASPPNIVDIIGADAKKRVKGILTTLRAVRDGRAVDEAELDVTLQSVGIQVREIAVEALKADILSENQRVGTPSIRKIRIRATTVQSSKGLADDYVFVTHFDDQYFIKNKDKSKITDQDICNFLVALTRARKRIVLISSDMKRKPTFLQWIDKGRIGGIGL